MVFGSNITSDGIFADVSRNCVEGRSGKCTKANVVKALRKRKCAE